MTWDIGLFLCVYTCIDEYNIKNFQSGMVIDKWLKFLEIISNSTYFDRKKNQKTEINQTYFLMKFWKFETKYFFKAWFIAFWRSWIIMNAVILHQKKKIFFAFMIKIWYARKVKKIFEWYALLCFASL